MIETSNRRDSRSQTRAGRTSGRFSAREGTSSTRADLGRPGRRNLAGAVGLVGLTAATSWVASTISGWLVPVYIGAMILIFAVPRPNRPRPDRADDAGDPSPVEDPLASSSVEVEVKVEAVDEAPPKPRKRRVRAKKSARGAAAAAPIADAQATAGVTWVRVGPGKFVRSVAPAPAAEFVGPPAPEAEAASEPNEDARQNPLMDHQDDAGDGFAINQENEHEGESTRPDDSEPTAEERGNTPSTSGEPDEDIVPDLEAGGDRGSWPAERSSSTWRDRATVGPLVAVFSRRLANVGRAVEAGLRRRSDAVRGGRINAHRDFHPRSPPGMRASPRFHASS